MEREREKTPESINTPDEPADVPGEGPNKAYLDFARARMEGVADIEGDLSKEERAAARQEGRAEAEDMEVFFEGASDELKRKVTPEMLVSFLGVLRGKKDANPKDILEIGNFLYNYRSDVKKNKEAYVYAEKPVEHDSPASFNKKECKLVNLACTLVENAFYKGNFENLSDNQGASLAFTANVLAKIFEQQRNNGLLKGFHPEKLKTLIGQVKAYEQKTLFPEALSESSLAPIDQLHEKMKQEALLHLNKADEILEKIKSENYFLELKSELEKNLAELQARRVARDMLDANGVAVGVEFVPLVAPPILMRQEQEEIETARKIVPFIGKESKTLTYLYEKIVELTREEVTSPIGQTSKFSNDQKAAVYSAISNSFTHTLFTELINQEEGRGDPSYISNLIDLRAEAGNLEHSLLGRGARRNNHTRNPYSPDKTDTRVYADFAELLAWTGRDKAEILMESVYELFDRKKLPGLAGDFVEQVKAANSLLRDYRAITVKHGAFSLAVNRLEGRADKPWAIAYVIKESLIRANMVRREPGAERELEIFGEPKSYFQTRENQNATPSYAMIGEKQVDYYSGRVQPGTNPAYATLHYIPEDMPFAVWFGKMQKSKAEGGSEKKINSEKETVGPKTEPVSEKKSESVKGMTHRELEVPILAFRAIKAATKAGKTNTSATHWLGELEKLSNAIEEGTFDNSKPRVKSYIASKFEKISDVCKKAAKEIGWDEKWFETMQADVAALPEALAKHELAKELVGMGLDEKALQAHVKETLIGKIKDFQSGKKVNIGDVIDEVLSRITQ